ncbi:cytochrome c-type biogenesis protein [Modicisalibacter luteus]|jgi:cytochrome c-type biogenesis protein CcmH|uniref:Cytochrome c-type biogenesis protein n=1 Tax=Modicisalibacter luteus TaxID=453962 RepID=A0ABV7M698_9GAMM|nr:cytochrome c-type biogenesis protein [Halomonas lutea]GHA98927.1 cytochrome c biogenesis protein [Halomonas lutea]
MAKRMTPLHRLLTASLLAMLLFAAGLAMAAIEVRQFNDPVMTQRYESLTDSLRCPKCANQAIGDSNSPIAEDMRERVAQLLSEGRSDREIQDYMIDRFGEYVLYNPRLTDRTWVLWGLPAALVVMGGIVIALIVRARRSASNRALSREERERLDALINRERTQ